MEKPKTLRVVSAVADKKQAILYLEDGETLVIKQGDHRLGDLLDHIIPITIRGEIAVVDLQDFSIYAAFEKKTQGATKFFRMAKNKVKGWFGGQTETHKATISEDGKQAIMAAVMGTNMTEKEVSEHGQPVDMTDEIGPDEVVVAVVTTPATETQPEKKAVIPGVQAIKSLIDHAVRTNSAEAVQNFLIRCAQFIDKRQHSVDDLMRFLERGDLPLAEDGSIIAYKMLKYGRHPKGGEYFVDCHSGNVSQRVGSYVCVNENLVDLNRRNECSNGLHIARRGYLSGFKGDVCVLCKIDPEDVMVVPHNDPNKVRVKGYHILGVMSDEAMKLLMTNKPMTGEEDALEMVYRAIKGDHIDRIERVQINGQCGSNVVVTKLKHDKNRGRNAFTHTGSDLKKAAALDDEANITGAVDPREINKRVTTEHEKLSGTIPDTVITDELDGMSDEELERLTAPDEPEEETSPDYGDYQGEHPDDDGLEPDADDEELKDAADFYDAVVANGGTNEGMGGLINEPEPTPAPAPGKTTAPTKAEQARALYDAGDMAALQAFKKKAKKGWSVLGFTEKEVKKILK